MSIQWFPGHMHLTRKAIGERIKDIDVVIELLDARLPGSSANPLLAELTGHKPALKVLNKQDVADPARTPAWLDWYNARPGTRAIAPNRRGLSRPMRVLICGIPNVGKSTLINTLSAKREAKTGDEAGITKQEQRIVLDDDFYLWDTPGMLWPRIIVPESGYRLAASGAVGRNAYDEEEVALELLAYVKRHYAPLLDARYRLGLDAQAIGASHDDELLALIAKKRGAVMSGGRLNLQKAAEIVLTDLRSAALGRVTLETPEEFEAWLAAARQREKERAERKAEQRKRDERRARNAPRDGG